jgi:hypothetical protein
VLDSSAAGDKDRSINGAEAGIGVVPLWQRPPNSSLARRAQSTILQAVETGRRKSDEDFRRV